MADQFTSHDVRSLTRLRRGERAVVSGLDAAASPAVARRLFDLGFRTGTEVTCVGRAPLGSPTIYRIGESDFCLRRREAALVSVDEVTQ